MENIGSHDTHHCHLQIQNDHQLCDRITKGSVSCTEAPQGSPTIRSHHPWHRRKSWPWSVWPSMALMCLHLRTTNPLWACTKRSSNCEGRMLFLTRGPYALLRFPQFCLREIPVFGYAYAVLTRSLWIRFCAQTCSGSLRTRFFR